MILFRVGSNFQSVLERTAVLLAVAALGLVVSVVFGFIIACCCCKWLISKKPNYDDEYSEGVRYGVVIPIAQIANSCRKTTAVGSM